MIKTGLNKMRLLNFNFLLKCLSLILILYPILVYFGLEYVGPTAVLYSLLGVLFFKIVISTLDKLQRVLMIASLIIIVVIGSWVSPEIGVKSYPVIVNLSLFTLFFSSLFMSKNIIEIFARKMDPTFTEEGVDYTRKVCIAWCLFFIFNGVMASVSITFSSKIWALYNGFISYILIGIMFTVEYCVRTFIIRKSKRT